jgi:hypothetical protein
MGLGKSTVPNQRKFVEFNAASSQPKDEYKVRDRIIPTCGKAATCGLQPESTIIHADQWVVLFVDWYNSWGISGTSVDLPSALQ